MYETNNARPRTDRMPGASSDKPMMSPDEDCVPLQALEMPGEDEQMNTPEVGDPVNYQVEGKVTRIEGPNAYIKRTTVNGQPVSKEGEMTNDDDSQSEREQLYAMAEGMNQGSPAEAAPAPVQPQGMS